MSTTEQAQIHRAIADLYETGWLDIGETSLPTAHAEARPGDFYWAYTADPVKARRLSEDIFRLCPIGDSAVAPRLHYVPIHRRQSGDPVWAPREKW